MDLHSFPNELILMFGRVSGGGRNKGSTLLSVYWMRLFARENKTNRTDEDRET